MERPEKTSDNDITAEPYKGPGAFVTGVGEGAVAHYGFAMGGMLVAGLLTFIFHEPAGRLVEKIRKGSRALEHNTAEGILSGAQRQIGKFANTVFGTGPLAEHANARKAVKGLDPASREALEKTISISEHGFGQWLLLHTVGLFPAGKRALQKHVDPQVTTSIAMGGMAGFLGFALSPIYFLFTGAKHANQGKDQFHRAQDEILTTRAERDALRNKYAESQVELETLRARTDRTANNNDALSVAKDNPPTLDAPHDAGMASLSTAAPTTTVAQATVADRIAQTEHAPEATLG